MSKTSTIYTRYKNPYPKEWKSKKYNILFWETCIKEMPINSSIIIGDKTGGRFKPTYQVDRLVTNYVIYLEDTETDQMTISEVIEYIKK